MNRRSLLSILAYIPMPFVSCAGENHSRKPIKQGMITGKISLQHIGSVSNAAAFISPGGITVGLDGTLYVCDNDNARIVRTDSTGRMLARFEGFDSRTNPLFLPVDISVSGGIEVYALDSAGSKVFRLDRNLKNAYVVYRAEPGEERRFGTFAGIAFDTQSGDIYITDRDRGAIIRIDMLGGNIHTSGGFGSGRQSLKKPAGLDTASDGSLIVADTGIGAIAVLSHFGESVTFIGGDILEAPLDVTELSQGLYAVADRSGIVIMDRHGTVYAVAGFDEKNEMSPKSVAYHDDILYVSDSASSSILMYRLDKSGTK